MTTPSFPDAAGEAAWRAAVGKVLNGGDVERLVSRTDDGLRVEPLYPAADAPAPVGDLARAGGRLPCVVMGQLDREGADGLAEVENGADGLVLAFAGSVAARGFGLLPTQLGAALDGVALDVLPLRLELPVLPGHDAVPALLDAARAARIDAGALDLDVGFDPLGNLAVTGGASDAAPRLLALVAGTVTALRDRGLEGPLLRADGRPHHEAGASEAQELAAVLATGLAYLRALDAVGIAPGDARRALSFLLAADADEMLTIAKFRAVRGLWARIETATGLAPAPIRLHGETAWRMMARRDPNTNLLRATLGCVGAVLGGADSVTVLPYTAPLGLADAAARRLARNTALVLRDEAGLDRVADPAAGSGAFEAMTAALSAEAWALLQDLERLGGLAAALASGAWQARLASTRARRVEAFRAGGRSIIGTTAFTPAEDAPAPVARPMSSNMPRPADALPGWRDDELLSGDGGAS